MEETKANAKIFLVLLIRFNYLNYPLLGMRQLCARSISMSTLIDWINQISPCQALIPLSVLSQRQSRIQLLIRANSVLVIKKRAL
jgi:hypothetical protein